MINLAHYIYETLFGYKRLQGPSKSSLYVDRGDNE